MQPAVFLGLGCHETVLFMQKFISRSKPEKNFKSMNPSAHELNPINSANSQSCLADSKFSFNPKDFLILVVDDNSQNLKLIGDILEDAGYETTFAMSGEQAFKRIETAKPDLILLDLMMPVMDGLEVCTRLKANLVYRAIPIIFLTASTEKQDLVKAFQRGAVDYITKPFWGEEVLSRIQNQLRLRLQAQQLQQLAQQEYEKSIQLQATLQKLRQTQIQLIQTAKMSSLNQTIAGIAHEINNPMSFISGNLDYAGRYFQDLLSLVELYQETYPNPSSKISQLQEEIDLNFILEDWQKLMQSMQHGANRITKLISLLRNFSRLDEAKIKSTDINQDIDNVLTILQNQLKASEHRPAIQTIREYGQLPMITCYASLLNQVLLNLLTNAIEALDKKAQTQRHKFQEAPNIKITTEVVRSQDASLPKSGFILIKIADNGCGIDPEIQQRIFEPFFTTKPIGSGMGLGLAISYQIVVETHKGNLRCVSVPGEGTQMIVEIPFSEANG